MTGTASRRRADDGEGMMLVARFYGRLGDHAVNITRRLGYLTGATTG